MKVKKLYQISLAFAIVFIAFTAGRSFEGYQSGKNTVCVPKSFTQSTELANFYNFGNGKEEER